MNSLDHYPAISTLAELKAMCTIDPETECWVWTDRIDGGVPIVKVLFAGKRKKIRGRAAALILASGKPVPKGYQARRNRDVCQNAQCVSPFHTHLVAVNAPPPPKPRVPERTAAKWRAMSSVFGFAEAMR